MNLSYLGRIPIIFRFNFFGRFKLIIAAQFRCLLSDDDTGIP